MGGDWILIATPLALIALLTLAGIDVYRSKRKPFHSKVQRGE